MNEEGSTKTMADLATEVESLQTAIETKDAELRDLRIRGERAVKALRDRVDEVAGSQPAPAKSKRGRKPGVPAEQAILRTLQEQAKPMTAEELAMAAGIGKPYARILIFDLVRQNAIARVDGGGNRIGNDTNRRAAAYVAA